MEIIRSVVDENKAKKIRCLPPRASSPFSAFLIEQNEPGFSSGFVFADFQQVFWF